MATWRISQPAPHLVLRRLPPRVRLAGPRAGSDAVADAVDAAELLGVDVEQLAGAGALVADRGRPRLEGGEAAEAEAPQHQAHGGDGPSQPARDLRPAEALPAQPLDAAPATCTRCVRTPRPPGRRPRPASHGRAPAGSEGVDHGPSCAHSCERSSEAPGPAVQVSQPQLQPQGLG